MKTKGRIPVNVMNKVRQALKGLACSAVISASFLAGTANAINYEIIQIKKPALSALPVFPPIPTLEPLATWISLSDINNKNEVVGTYRQLYYSRDQGNIITKKPFIYNVSDDKTFYELRGSLFHQQTLSPTPYLPEDFFGGATAINDYGNILFYEEDENSEEYKESYFYEFSGRNWYLTSLGFRGHDINNKRNIAGEKYVKIGKISPRDNKHLVEICPDSNDFYTAYAINDNDFIVGNILDKDYPYFSRTKPFRGEAARIELPRNNYKYEINITELPLPPGYNQASALDINNNGQSVGFAIKYYSRGYDITAMMWENESYKELPLTKAYSINNKGQVAGTTHRRAVIWDNNEVTYLSDFITPDNPDGWAYLYEARKINDNGWVIGYGHKPYPSEKYFEDQTPIPFLAIPREKENTKTLSADSNNDGIVNHLDFAEFAEQWLLTEDWYEEDNSNGWWWE